MEDRLDHRTGIFQGLGSKTRRTDHIHTLLDHKRYQCRPATAHYYSELSFTPGAVSHDATTVYERRTLKVLLDVLGG